MNSTCTTSPALAANGKPHNFTRRTANLTSKFWRTGQWHLIPLYYLLRLSDLAREGIERSGSYRFADHLYRNRASGRFFVGKLLDRLVLNSRAARGMRARCAQASAEMERALDAAEGPFSILAVPCGVPRDVADLVARRQDLASRMEYVAMDIDAEVIAAAREHLIRDAPALLAKAAWLHGNALVDLDYPMQSMDFVVSTGLGEFLNDEQLRQFYRNVFVSLSPGGRFFTSATRREASSDYLLRAFELETQYRNEDQMRKLFAELPWSRVEFSRDATGLQTFILAYR
ncbi:MAG TPA: class I SAM-dependent methyltransferase [Prosthecobacter sp.]|nr:class I SAM-dependent methyltransferase [Prosthecobacter sp.]